MAAKNDYFGLPYIVSLILAIFFGPILGIIVRFMEGKMVAGIVRLIVTITGVGAIVLLIIDFVCMIIKKSIWRAL